MAVNCSISLTYLSLNQTQLTEPSQTQNILFIFEKCAAIMKIEMQKIAKAQPLESKKVDKDAPAPAKQVPKESSLAVACRKFINSVA